MTMLKSAGRRYKQELDIDVFTAARARMRYVYEEFDTVVISWSGGKDSSTCLELAREAAREQGKLPIKVLFLDEEVIYPETLDLAYRHKADPDIEFYWVCVPSIYRNACSEKEPDFIPFDPQKRALWTHEPPADALWPAGFDEAGLPNMTNWRVPPSIPKRMMIELFAKHKDVYGKVANVTGLRTQESYVRYSGLMSSGDFVTKPEKGVWGVRPVYDWKATDIWLAIKENAWDYNKAYDKLWRAGANRNTARVAPLFHAEAAMQMRQVMLFWPHFWQQVKRRVTGAHAVAIYGAVILAVIITLYQKGMVMDTTLKMGTYETPRDWLLSLWTIPLLLTNPFIDGTFWHRAKYANSMRPYWWGFAMFFTYLCFVAILGLLGPTITALSLLYVVVFFAANSTMDSTASALHLTAGKKVGVWLGLLMIVAWIPVSTFGLLDAWLAMFIWFPFIFAWQVVTYILEKRGILSDVNEKSLAARDALPMIENEHLVLVSSQ